MRRCPPASWREPVARQPAAQAAASTSRPPAAEAGAKAKPSPFSRRATRDGDIVPKQALRLYKSYLYARGAPLRTGWVWGCLYLVAYGGWAWFFRSNVDSWARRQLGGRLGVRVVWLPATTFPLEIWVWGLVGHGRARRVPSILESRVALGSAAMCLTGAFMPTAALCLLLRWSPSLSEELGPALYLTTPPLILLFAASHLRSRATDPPETVHFGEQSQDRRSGRRPSDPPGSFGAGRES
jgi:hypothetical protein